MSDEATGGVHLLHEKKIVGFFICDWSEWLEKYNFISILMHTHARKEK